MFAYTSFAAAQTSPPAFATEFALDYRVQNYAYGFVTVGRWSVDHRNSSGALNLRERTDNVPGTASRRILLHVLPPLGTEMSHPAW